MSKGIKIEIKGLKMVNKALTDTDKTSRLALSAAVNRTVAFAKSQLSKSIRSQYAVTQADMQKSISIAKEATPASPTAVIRLRGELNTIYWHFRVAPKFRPMGKVKKYKINLTIKNGQKKTLNGRVFLPASTSTKQNTQLWFRTGRARNATIRPLHTLSVAQMVNDEVAQDVDKKAGEMLEKRLQHELEYRLEKLTGKYEKK